MVTLERDVELRVLSILTIGLEEILRRKEVL